MTFPMLIFTGVPAIQANATSSVAVWPGTVASTVGYRRELRQQRQLFVPMAHRRPARGRAGGGGAAEDAAGYVQAAGALAAAGGDAAADLRRADGAADQAAAGARDEIRTGSLAGVTVVQFLLGIYGGYFGGGMGFVMLAAMAFIGLDNMHIMNALKTALAVASMGWRWRRSCWRGRWPGRRRR
ncbi:MAG: TSUP family transporter [Chloroflexia bacterium]